MVPDPDLQLQVVVKTLQDAVQPAVPAADRLATEQLALAIATLGMLRSQLPLQRRMVRRLLADHIQLAEAIEASSPAGLGQTIGEARAILADPDAEACEIEACRSHLNQAVSNRLAECGGEGVVLFREAILGLSKPVVDKIRAWFAGAGFEAEATDIKPIEHYL